MRPCAKSIRPQFSWFLMVFHCVLRPVHQQKRAMLQLYAQRHRGFYKLQYRAQALNEGPLAWWKAAVLSCSGQLPVPVVHSWLDLGRFSWPMLGRAILSIFWKGLISSHRYKLSLSDRVAGIEQPGHSRLRLAVIFRWLSTKDHQNSQAQRHRDYTIVQLWAPQLPVG